MRFLLQIKITKFVNHENRKDRELLPLFQSQ